MDEGNPNRADQESYRASSVQNVKQNVTHVV